MQKLSKLYEDMKAILDRRDLDDFSKATAYSQVLGRYLGVKDQLDTPTSISLMEDSFTGTSPIVDNDETMPNYTDVTLFPKSFQNRALHLLNRISKQQDMSWSDRGESLIEGKPLAGTHIVDLVYNVMRSIHKRPDSLKRHLCSSTSEK